MNNGTSNRGFLSQIKRGIYALFGITDRECPFVAAARCLSEEEREVASLMPRHLRERYVTSRLDISRRLGGLDSIH